MLSLVERRIGKGTSGIALHDGFGEGGADADDFEGGVAVGVGSEVGVAGRRGKFSLGRLALVGLEKDLRVCEVLGSAGARRKP